MSLFDYWYVLCRSHDLTDSPLSTQLFGQPLVVFRGEGAKPVALLDRCAHRNVPLSLGSVRKGTLECRYHGWRFDSTGACAGVPGLCAKPLPSACVPRYVTAEQDGYIWAWARPDAEPREPPYRLEALDTRHTVIHNRADYQADLLASLENTIDVPHTVFLHQNLFRSANAGQSITCNVTRTSHEVRAEYAGESRPDTWLARILAPGGGKLEHEDRFILPCIVRVEYRLGARLHLSSSAFFTPLDDKHTRVHVRTAYRLGVPGAFLAPLLERVSARVLREDAWILQRQTENLARFSGPHFASSEIDLFSGQIKRLLDEAAAGTLSDTVHKQSIQIKL